MDKKLTTKSSNGLQALNWQGSMQRVYGWGLGQGLVHSFVDGRMNVHHGPQAISNHWGCGFEEGNQVPSPYNGSHFAEIVEKRNKIAFTMSDEHKCSELGKKRHTRWLIEVDVDSCLTDTDSDYILMSKLNLWLLESNNHTAHLEWDLRKYLSMYRVAWKMFQSFIRDNEGFDKHNRNHCF